MNTAFEIGQEVTAKLAVQGLQLGRLYRVFDVVKRHTAFGTFVTYWLDTMPYNRNEPFPVVNGHMLLESSPWIERAS